MIDYYLKFRTEAAANKVLFLADAEGVLQSLYPEHSIDVVGKLYKPTGVVITMNGVDQPVMAALTGWHVNVRGPENEALAKYAVPVNTPSRVWA